MDLIAIFTSSFWKDPTWLEPFAAFLTIIGIPYAILYTLVIKPIYRAKPRIYFDANETYHEAVVADIEGNPMSYWLQVMVKNEGFEMARETRIYIEEIWKKSKKSYEKFSDFRSPVVLKWSHENHYNPIDIFPRAERRLDICHIRQGNPVLYIATEDHAAGSVRAQLTPGEYVFVLRGASTNGLLPHTFFLKVSWDGNWKTLKGASFLRSLRLATKPVKSLILQ